MRDAAGGASANTALPPQSQGGKTVKAIAEATGAMLDIQDSGEVFVSAPDSAAARAAMDMVAALTTPLEVGAVFRRAAGRGGGAARRTRCP
jgi:polyribonucleotide nucleotidyltransferase